MPTKRIKNGATTGERTSNFRKLEILIKSWRKNFRWSPVRTLKEFSLGELTKLNEMDIDLEEIKRIHNNMIELFD